MWDFQIYTFHVVNDGFHIVLSMNQCIQVDMFIILTGVLIQHQLQSTTETSSLIVGQTYTYLDSKSSSFCPISCCGEREINSLIVYYVPPDYKKMFTSFHSAWMLWYHRTVFRTETPRHTRKFRLVYIYIYTIYQ